MNKHVIAVIIAVIVVSFLVGGLMVPKFLRDSDRCRRYRTQIEQQYVTQLRILRNHAKNFHARWDDGMWTTSEEYAEHKKLFKEDWSILGATVGSRDSVEGTFAWKLSPYENARIWSSSIEVGESTVDIGVGYRKNGSKEEFVQYKGKVKDKTGHVRQYRLLVVPEALEPSLGKN